MVELTLLALMHLGYAPVIATRTVAADAAELDAYLTDPLHERRLLGAPATVRPSRSPGLVTAHLTAGRGAEIWATWILEPRRGSTEVTLAAQVEPRGPALQLALLLGGRRRIERRLDRALARLARVCADRAEQVAPAPALSPATRCPLRAHRRRPAADPLREARAAPAPRGARARGSRGRARAAAATPRAMG